MINLLARATFILLLTSLFGSVFAQNASKKPFMGTTVDDNIPAVREQYKLKDNVGVQVIAIIEHSSAQQAGIQVKDVLVGLNDSTIRSTPQFIALVQAYKAGDTVKLTLYRNGKKKVQPVVLKSKAGNQIK